MRDSDIIAANMRRIRLAKGMTQEALAKKCERSTNQINGYENARYKPSDRLLEVLAKGLGVTVSELITPVIEGQLEVDTSETASDAIRLAKELIVKAFRVSPDQVSIHINL